MVRRLARLPLRRVGRQAVGNLVIHLVLPPADDRATVRTLRRSRARLAWAGIGHITVEELGSATTLELQQAIGSLRVRRPIRAVIVSTGQPLGAAPVADPAELAHLRPDAESTIHELMTGLGVESATVVVDLPRLDDLIIETLIRRVDRGDTLREEIRPVPDLYERLVDRVAAAPGVGAVRLEVDDGSRSPRQRVQQILGGLGAGVQLKGPGGPSRRDGWTLGSLLAASAVAPHVDAHERPLVHDALRTMIAGKPSRPPQCLIPCRERRLFGAAGEIAGCGGTGIRELHLHVGIQETGPATVQRAMRSAREALRESGVVYVDRTDMMGLPDIRGWAAFRPTRSKAFADFAAQLRAVIREHQSRSEKAGFASDVVFISNEALVGSIEPGPFLERPFRPRAEGAIFEILDVLQPDACHLSMVIRRQDTLIESQYIRQLRGGESFGFDRYLAAAMRRPDALSYGDLAARLGALIGVESLLLQPYELMPIDLNRFLNGLLAPMGTSVDFEPLAPPHRADPSYSQAAMLLARATSPHLDSRREISAVGRFLRRTFPIGKDYPAASMLGESDRAELIRMHASDNEAVFSRWMPEFPSDAYGRLDTTDALREGWRV